ncbi:hypothetical protein KSP39_PZI018799 [Platanthera zijinensis]|uniref:Uncharacterized protein n=1 Tax=Platanthera zijinensis TaxID=2320716 RepID=A0AAP0FYI6_9ASPA
MFINGSEYSNDSYLWTIGDRITSQICISIFFSLITIIPDTSWYGIFRTTKSNQIIEQDLISNVQQIGIHLSIDYHGTVVAFLNFYYSKNNNSNPFGQECKLLILL